MVLLLPAFAGTLHAGTTYSLIELCEIADKTAQDIRIAREDLYISKQDKKRALSVLVPRITAYGSRTDYKDAEYQKRNPDTDALGVKINQSFTLNGKELIAYDISKDEIDKKAYDLERIKSDYLFEVAKTFYNILSARKFVDIANSDRKRLEKHRDAVQERLNVGDVTKTALYRAEAELSKSKTEYVKAVNNLKLAKASLKNLVDIEEPFTVTNDAKLGLEEFDSSLDQLKKAMFEKRPELKKAQKNIEVAQKNIRYEKGAFWPELSIEGEYADTDTEYDKYPRMMEDPGTETINKSITAQLTFTIFDGGLRRADIRQALAGERKAENGLAKTKDALLLELKDAWYQYQTARSSLKTLKDELKSARENYNAVRMQFKYGLADSVDMMDANTLLVTAERKFSDARYQHTVSILNLIRTRGDLVDFLLSGSLT
ncbi:MAG: TolC family protein [Desulfarculaceae bacterium]|nr:TolC family protein [Desulfarculaceae bacterium]